MTCSANSNFEITIFFELTKKFNIDLMGKIRTETKTLNNLLLQIDFDRLLSNDQKCNPFGEVGC